MNTDKLIILFLFVPCIAKIAWFILAELLSIPEGKVQKCNIMLDTLQLLGFIASIVCVFVTR